jgi:hypothetical protein
MKRDCSTVCNSWFVNNDMQRDFIRSPTRVMLHGGHLNTKAWYVVGTWFPMFEAWL